MQQDRVIRTLVSERAKLLAYAWSILRDEHAAEDVYQEAMLLAVQKCDEIPNAAALLAWTRTAIRFRALHLVRDQGRSARVLGDAALDALDEAWQQHDETPAAELADALNQCVEQLSPYAQQIVSLRYGDGLSGQDVAQALSRNVRTIYMALTRIHNSLRDCIRTRLAAEA